MDDELREILELMNSKFDEKLSDIQGELGSIKRELADNKEEMKIVNYKLDKNIEEVQVINYKLDRTNGRFDNLDLKVDNLDLRIRSTEINIRKDIKKLSDENETVIEVLKQHDFLPN